MATYYTQRATAGLIITESTQPSVVGQGYLNSPGLHSADRWPLASNDRAYTPPAA